MHASAFKLALGFSQQLNVGGGAGRLGNSGADEERQGASPGSGLALKKGRIPRGAPQEARLLFRRLRGSGQGAGGPVVERFDADVLDSEEQGPLKMFPCLLDTSPGLATFAGVEVDLDFGDPAPPMLKKKAYGGPRAQGQRPPRAWRGPVGR